MSGVFLLSLPGHFILVMKAESSNTIRKKDGFNGQKAIVLPKPVVKTCARHAIMKNLHITDIGFYPKALFHYREREHGSKQDILIYCADGAGWANIENKQIQILQGEYIIIPRNLKHKYGADSEHPWSIYWVHFNGNNACDFLNILKGEKDNFGAPVPFSEDRIRLFNAMYNTLATGYSANNLLYVNLILNGYLASFCYPNLYNIPEKQEVTGIEIVIEYMQEHIRQNISLAEMAQLIHVSTSHFSALFKKKTGYPPVEYFTHLKIQMACQFLEFTNMHVKELSYHLGFSDPFYFSRLFSKYMGMPPLEYRKKKQYK